MCFELIPFYKWLVNVLRTALEKWQLSFSLILFIPEFMFFFVFLEANSTVILFFFQFANIVFLGLFSFFVLTDLHPLGEKGAPSIVEIFTWIYTITSVIEEMRQVSNFLVWMPLYWYARYGVFLYRCNLGNNYFII